MGEYDRLGQLPSGGVMRIGLALYGDLDTLTGGFLYDKYLVQHLRRAGHAVEVLSLPWRTYPRHLADNWSHQVLARIRRGAFDLLLQDELTHPSFFVMNRLLRRHGDLPVIAIVHQVLCCQPRQRWINLFYRAVERRYLTSVDGCIVNSQSTEIMVKSLILRPCPSVVARPGGDRLGALASPESIVSRACRPGPLRLLFLGNVLPNKGLLRLLDALLLLPSYQWRLTVVGSLTMDRGYAQRVRQFLRQNRLTRQVYLTGALEGEAIRSHLHESHLLLMPFSHEGFGIAYLEGMAYGLPAFGSSQGALKEMIEPGRNGFLIEPRDAEGLRQQVQRLYADRALLRSMGQAAFATFRRYPTWNESMERIHQFLLRFAQGRGASRD